MSCEEAGTIFHSVWSIFQVSYANETLEKIAVTTCVDHWLLTPQINAYWLTESVNQCAVSTVGSHVNIPECNIRFKSQSFSKCLSSS